MKLLGTDKYHGNYVGLRNDNKWENVKVQLLTHVSILTKRVIKTLFVITVTHLSLWYKTAGQYSSISRAEYSVMK